MIDKKTGLTDKQKRFCEEYVIDWNGARSARVAGYSGSPKVLSAIAYENLGKPYIQEYIENIKNNLEQLAGVSALRNLLELRKIAYSNLSNLKNDWISFKDFADLTDDEKACIQSAEITTLTNELGEKVTGYKIRLYDKLKALETINKQMGYNATEKLDLTSKGNEIEQNNINFVVSDVKLSEKLTDFIDEVKKGKDSHK